MPISEYLRGVRQKIGNDLLLLPSVTGVVWNADAKLLLIRQKNSSAWTLPGGIVDPGESPAYTLAREVWEETGIRVIPNRVIGVFGGPEGFRRTYSNGHQVEYVDTVFECSVVGGNLGDIDDEVAEARFFSRSEFKGLPFQYPIKLEEITRPTGSPTFIWNDKWLERLH